MTDQLKQEFLIKAMKAIRKMGYRVFLTYWGSDSQYRFYTYAHITDNDMKRVGCVQVNEWCGTYHFSTCRKPTKKYGTGAVVTNEVELNKISKKHIESALSTVAPWERIANRSELKWESFDEWKQKRYANHYAIIFEYKGRYNKYMTKSNNH